MRNSLQLRARKDRSGKSGRQSDARRRLAAASVLAVVLIVTTAAGAIWRYEVALGHSDAALEARADAHRTQQASTALWQEREAMNEYLLHPVPRLLGEVKGAQTRFEVVTKELVASAQAERGLVVVSRSANARFMRTFAQNRRQAGLGWRLELPAIRQLNAAEAGVVESLDALAYVYLREARRRHAAKDTTDSEAVLAGLLSTLIAGAVTAGLALYCRRLLIDVHARRVAELDANTAHHEFAEMLQSTEAEEEADHLLKRHLELSVNSSSVVVLRRNNSDDRLLATTQPDATLAERLADAEPRSCLAIRFSRKYEQADKSEPLIRCALCSCENGYSTCQPLLVGGEVLGATLVRHSRPLSEPEHTAIIGAVGQAGPVLANLRNLALARYRAATDALTGLPNSREVQDTLKRMAAHAARTLSPLAALMLDLDHFKEINDNDGHGRGDDVLAAIGTTLQATLRTSDFVGRYGGEEFVILLPDTGREEAELVAEKIRAAVETVTVSGVTQPITASIGLAVLPEDAGDSVTLLRNADRALYAAKSNGRNRVEVAQFPRPTAEAITAERP